MIRLDRKELTRREIIRIATKTFLRDGYTCTAVSAMCKKLHMGTSNWKFYFPTKEHLLAELTDMFVKFKQGKTDCIADGNPMMGKCIELLTMASACEQDEVAKDFFVSAYTSPMCLEIIRRNDIERSEEIFGKYCPDWADERFIKAETLASGIEYGTLQLTESSAPLEARVSGALELILTIYNLPSEERKELLEKVLAVDHMALGSQMLEDFRKYVDDTTEQALLGLVEQLEDSLYERKQSLLTEEMK